MQLNLNDSISCDLASDMQLHVKPRWGLRDLSLMLGPYTDGDAHEQHILQTVGSGNWYRSESDELRFAKTDLVLQSAWFRVPEQIVESSPALVDWISMPPMQGLPRLNTTDSFELEVSRYRCIEPNGGFLICSADAQLNRQKSQFRLRLAEDFDLLFAEDTMVGWMLCNPDRYLVNAWEEPYSEEPNDNTRRMLVEYLELLIQPNIELMEDEDPDVLSKLQDLQTRINQNSDPCTQRLVLSECLKDVIDSFYD